MKIADFCIKHRVMTILAYIMIVVFGIFSFGTLPLALMPEMNLPMAIVMTTYAGAGPEEIENLVTKPIESACASLSGMDKLQSTSQENMSIIMVTFVNDTDMDQALIDMREKGDQTKSTLPDDASDPVVMKLDMDAMPVVVFGLKGDDLAQLQAIADDTIVPRLERIDGVASVETMGGYENEVSIELRTDRTEGYGLSVSYIAQMLGADNVAIPGGEIQNGKQKLSVRSDGEYKSVKDVENTLIPLPTGGTVRLGEIADVAMKPKEQDSIAKVDGESCIMITVSKQSGVNTVKVAENATKAMQEMQAENPMIHYTALMDHIYGEDGSSLSEDDLNAFLAENEYVTVKHILFKTTDDSGAALSDEDKAAKKQQAETAAAQLKAETDQTKSVELFDTLMNENSEDPGLASYPNGYCFTSGQMLEAFETASKALEEYGVSDVVETTAGYHVILRLPTTPDDVVSVGSDGTVQTLRYIAAATNYDSLLNGWMDEAEIVWEPAFETLDYAAIFTPKESFWKKLDVFGWFD